MNAFLLDTNFVIDFFHGEKNAVEWIKNKTEAQLKISVISLAELYHGAYKTPTPKIYIEHIKNFIQDFSIEILPADESIAVKYGEIVALNEKKGKTGYPLDFLIASTTLIHNILLITHDKYLLTLLGNNSQDYNN